MKSLTVVAFKNTLFVCTVTEEKTSLILGPSFHQLGISLCDVLPTLQCTLLSIHKELYLEANTAEHNVPVCPIHRTKNFPPGNVSQSLREPSVLKISHPG